MNSKHDADHRYDHRKCKSKDQSVVTIHQEPCKFLVQGYVGAVSRFEALCDPLFHANHHRHVQQQPHGREKQRSISGPNAILVIPRSSRGCRLTAVLEAEDVPLSAAQHVNSGRICRQGLRRASLEERHFCNLRGYHKHRQCSKAGCSRR